MGYHHLALVTRDIKAIHAFYEGVMGFELVKVEVQPQPEGGWVKHFFYRMEDDSKFIAFWELHDVPGVEDPETDLSRAAGVTTGAFDEADRERALEALDAPQMDFSPPPASISVHPAEEPAPA